jgi:hypothetical protein
MATEKRLIDANALLNTETFAVSDSACKECENEYRWEVMNAPTVDAVEVVHGRWMGGYKNRKGRWLYTKPCCSVCSFEQEGISNYCPNCGADMRGEEDG